MFIECQSKTRFILESTEKSRANKHRAYKCLKQSTLKVLFLHFSKSVFSITIVAVTCDQTLLPSTWHCLHYFQYLTQANDSWQIKREKRKKFSLERILGLPHLQRKIVLFVYLRCFCRFILRSYRYV